jgi:integrase/recombinase XerD
MKRRPSLAPRKVQPRGSGFKSLAHERGDDPLGHLLMARYVDAHCEWLAVTGYAEDTVRTRRRALRTFVAWAHERGLTDPREITKPILERYQRHLYYYRKEDGSPLVPGTQVNLLRALKTFFKWATRENHILYNPASELDTPRVHRRLPRHILTVAEVAAILNEAHGADAASLRDRALLELLYSTGLRRKEAANLTRGSIDFIRQVVFVKEGKGGRDRVVPLGSRAAAWLEKYLYEARPQLTVHDATALFVTDYGDPISGPYVATRVKRAMALAGIERPGAAHLLRHACATHMLEGGADIRFIQALLGHANLNTTEIYTHVSIEQLKIIHAATHPARLQRRQATPAQPDGASPRLPDSNAAQALLEVLDDEADQDADPSR